MPSSSSPPATWSYASALMPPIYARPESESRVGGRYFLGKETPSIRTGPPRHGDRLTTAPSSAANAAIRRNVLASAVEAEVGALYVGGAGVVKPKKADGGDESQPRGYKKMYKTVLSNISSSFCAAARRHKLRKIVGALRCLYIQNIYFTLIILQ